MTRLLMVCVVFCLAGAAAGAQAATTRSRSPITYSNDDYDFSFRIPGTWQELPRELMEQMADAMPDISDEFELEVMVGYGSAKPGLQPIALTYVCVFYFPDKRQISKREINRGVKDLTGIDISKIKRATGGGNEAMSNVKAIRTLGVEYDDERRLLIWDCEADVAGLATLRGRNLMFFGRRTCVMIYGFALPEKFDECKRAISMAQQSFAFGPDAQYVELEWFESPVFAWTLIVVASSGIALTLRKR